MKNYSAGQSQGSIGHNIEKKEPLGKLEGERSHFSSEQRVLRVVVYVRRASQCDEFPTRLSDRGPSTRIRKGL